MTGEIEEFFFKSAMFSPKLTHFLQISYILTTFSQEMTGENPNLCKGLSESFKLILFSYILSAPKRAPLHISQFSCPCSCFGSKSPIAYFFVHKYVIRGLHLNRGKGIKCVNNFSTTKEIQYFGVK